MFTNTDVSELARYIKSPMAQRALWKLDGGVLLPILSRNPNLDRALWDEIYDSLEPKSDQYDHARLQVRARLFAIAPSPKQAARILEESDAGTSLSVIAAGIPNLTSAIIKELIATPFFSEPYAHSLIEGRQVSKATAICLWHKYLKQSALHFGSDVSTSLDLLVTHYGLLTASQVLETIDSWQVLDYLLPRAIDMKPEIIALITKKQSLSPYYPFLSLSRHLPPELADEIATYLVAKATSDPKLLNKEDLDSLSRLASNPWVSAGVRLKCLDILVDMPRCFSENGISRLDLLNYQISREELLRSPSESALVNPTTRELAAADFTPEQLDGLYNAVIDSGGWNYPSLHKLLDLTYHGYDLQDLPTQEPDDLPLYELTDEYLAPLLNPHGVATWQMFLSLLPEWRGEIKELLPVAISTATA